MRRLKLFVIGSLFFALCGCIKDDVEIRQENPVAGNEMPDIQMSLEGAKEHVEGLLGQIDVRTRGLGSVRRIEDVYRVKDVQRTRAEGDASPVEHYILNFADNQGFAFVLGDNRLESPVLAITDTGYLDPEVPVDNPGLITALALGEQWYANQVAIFETEADETIEINPDLDMVWVEYMEMPKDIWLSLLLGKVKGVYMEDWQTKDYGRRTYLEWYQEAPFWNNLPKISGKEPMLGCTATATMLLMAWHQYPKVYGGHTYNWEEMLKHNNTLPGSGTASATTESDLAKLAEIITRKENLDMTFGRTSSGAWEQNIPRTLKRLGYFNGGTYRSWNQEIALDELMFYPVVVSAYSTEVITEYGFWGLTFWTSTSYKGGHTFLLETLTTRTRRRLYTEDQIRKAIKANPDRCEDIKSLFERGVKFYKKYTQTLVYINWGWDGSYNGYFNPGVFDRESAVTTRSTGTEGNYQFDIDMVYGMRP